MSNGPDYTLDIRDFLSNSDGFMAALNAIPTDSPVTVRLEGIHDELAEGWVDILWQWQFYCGKRDRANIHLDFDSARARVLWDGRIVALMDEHHPRGFKGLLEHWFETAL
jgi:hypothetical protein